MRSNVQDGYKYSILDKSRIIWLSKDIFMIDATYSRYNNDYKSRFLKIVSERIITPCLGVYNNYYKIVL